MNKTVMDNHNELSKEFTEKKEEPTDIEQFLLNQLNVKNVVLNYFETNRLEVIEKRIKNKIYSSINVDENSEEKLNQLISDLARIYVNTDIAKAIWEERKTQFGIDVSLISSYLVHNGYLMFKKKHHIEQSRDYLLAEDLEIENSKHSYIRLKNDASLMEYKAVRKNLNENFDSEYGLVLKKRSNKSLVESLVESFPLISFNGTNIATSYDNEYYNRNGILALEAHLQELPGFKEKLMDLVEKNTSEGLSQDIIRSVYSNWLLFEFEKLNNYCYNLRLKQNKEVLDFIKNIPDGYDVLFRSISESYVKEFDDIGEELNLFKEPAVSKNIFLQKALTDLMELEDVWEINQAEMLDYFKNIDCLETYRVMYKRLENISDRRDIYKELETMQDCSEKLFKGLVSQVIPNLNEVRKGNLVLEENDIMLLIKGMIAKQKVFWMCDNVADTPNEVIIEKVEYIEDLRVETEIFESIKDKSLLFNVFDKMRTQIGNSEFSLNSSTSLCKEDESENYDRFYEATLGRLENMAKILSNTFDNFSKLENDEKSNWLELSNDFSCFPTVHYRTSHESDNLNVLLKYRSIKNAGYIFEFSEGISRVSITGVNNHNDVDKGEFLKQLFLIFVKIRGGVEEGENISNFISEQLKELRLNYILNQSGNDDPRKLPTPKKHKI